MRDSLQAPPTLANLLRSNEAIIEKRKNSVSMEEILFGQVLLRFVAAFFYNAYCVW